MPLFLSTAPFTSVSLSLSPLLILSLSALPLSPPLLVYNNTCSSSSSSSTIETEIYYYPTCSSSLSSYMASSSSSSSQKRSSLTVAVAFLLFVLCTSSEVVHSNFVESSDQQQQPSSSSDLFLNSVKSTIEQVESVISLVSQFGNAFDHDFRLSNAINDCLDLLDFSADQLTWAQSATLNPNGKDNSTGNRNSDLRTWLSAAFGNQDTCIEGFDGTNDLYVKNLISGSLQQVTLLVGDILATLPPHLPAPGRRNLMLNHNFPPSSMTEWERERRLLQAPTSSASASAAADVVVAADGTGDFTRVTDAVLAAPDYSTRRYVIYVKKGVYKENVEIKKKKWNLMMIGDGLDVTIISGNRSFIDGWTTFRSATFAVAGRGFIARDMTFENTAGPEKHQAVALRSDSDLSTFFRCGIRGYQDTLYAHSLRQFYRECLITGTVDFIFGNGAVVFQNCQILTRKPLPDQKNTITAQGRKDPNQNTGFSIQFSNISADYDLLSSLNSTATYLGRPWKEYSRTVFLQSYISSAIRPEGWLEWQGDFAIDTLYYGEYMNYGGGSPLGRPVKWPGYHAINDSTHATNFTVSQFIDGNLWLPYTGVRFTAGLGV